MDEPNTAEDTGRSPTALEGDPSPDSSAFDAESPEIDDGGFSVPDPFAGEPRVGESSLPPGVGPEEADENIPDEPVFALVRSNEPRFERREDLDQAYAQFAGFFPRGRSASPGHGGATRRGVLGLFAVGFPAFVVLTTATAGFTAGLGSFVQNNNQVSLFGGLFSLLVDVGACVLLAVGSSAAATWAARLNRCWNGTLVAALAGLGAFTGAAFVFLPLVGEVPPAPVGGWLGPFQLVWVVVGLGLLVTPVGAVAMAMATIRSLRICPETGRGLRPTLRVRFGILEASQALAAVAEGRLEDLAELDGLPGDAQNFIECTLFASEGARLALLEFEARFWAELGPAGQSSGATPKARKSKRWLVLSKAIETTEAAALLSLDWLALEGADSP